MLPIINSFLASLFANIFQHIPLVPELLETGPSPFLIQDDPGFFDLPEIPEEFLGETLFLFVQNVSVFGEALLRPVSEIEFFLKAV
jgi:hypothetical protein